MSETLQSQLVAFTDRQLHEELLRRIESVENFEDALYCESCKHFKVYAARKLEPPPEFNPCGKRHKMDFELPKEWDFASGGFFRRGCLDYEERG